MQAAYDSEFSREMGCTPQEWLGWLPQAIGAHPWQREGDAVHIQIHDNGVLLGLLRIEWEEAAARRIALMRIPRLLVHFTFTGLDTAQRYQFMRRFDLYMQRGGG
ncbi:MAG: hypothetical protein RLZZ498_605 [Pseudomonadota bacterium]